jgi:hypothetical protein
MQVYVATFVAAAFAAQQDVFEIVAPSDSAVEILDLRLGQYSDFGDAQAEILSLQIIRGYTVAGSGGGTATPEPVVPGGKAAGSTVLVNNTTIASGGSPKVLLADVMNVQAGYWYYPPIPNYPNQLASFNERYKLAKSQRGVVRLSAPADALTMNGTLIFRELGDIA